jgi:hypothetical protein
MKLVYASLAFAGGALGLNVDSWIQDTMDKVFQERADGFSISLEPYFKLDHTGYGQNQVSTGYLGSGDGTVQFTRTMTANSDMSVIQEVFEEQGTVNGIPGYQFLYPQHAWEYEWDCTNTWKVDVNQQSLEWSSVGVLNNVDFNMQQSARITKLQMSKKGAKVQANIAGTYAFGAGFPMELMLFTIPDHDFNLSAAASNQCMGAVGPFSPGCKATVKVSGSLNNAAIPDQDFSYKANSKMLKCSYSSGGQWQFKMQVKLAKYYTVKYMCRSSGVMSWAHALTVPGPDAFVDIHDALTNYFVPFTSYFEALIASLDTFAHGATYVDTTLQYIQGKSFFDCSAVVVAVGFECPPLAQAIGANPPLMQNFLQEGCVQFNSMMEGFAAQGVQPVAEARGYVADLTGPAGQAQFNSWWASVIA